MDNTVVTVVILVAFIATFCGLSILARRRNEASIDDYVVGGAA